MKKMFYKTCVLAAAVCTISLINTGCAYSKPIETEPRETFAWEVDRSSQNKTSATEPTTVNIDEIIINTKKEDLFEITTKEKDVLMFSFVKNNHPKVVVESDTILINNGEGGTLRMDLYDEEHMKEHLMSIKPLVLMTKKNTDYLLMNYKELNGEKEHIIGWFKGTNLGFDLIGNTDLISDMLIQTLYGTHPNGKEYVPAYFESDMFSYKYSDEEYNALEEKDSETFHIDINDSDSVDFQAVGIKNADVSVNNKTIIANGAYMGNDFNMELTFLTEKEMKTYLDDHKPLRKMVGTFNPSNEKHYLIFMDPDGMNNTMYNVCWYNGKTVGFLIESYNNDLIPIANEPSLFDKFNIQINSDAEDESYLPDFVKEDRIESLEIGPKQGTELLISNDDISLSSNWYDFEFAIDGSKYEWSEFPSVETLRKLNWIDRKYDTVKYEIITTENETSIEKPVYNKTPDKSMDTIGNADAARIYLRNRRYGINKISPWMQLNFLTDHDSDNDKKLIYEHPDLIQFTALEYQRNAIDQFIPSKDAPNITIANGIHFGSTANDVVDAFGDAAETNEINNMTVYKYNESEKSMWIACVDNTVCGFAFSNNEKAMPKWTCDRSSESKEDLQFFRAHGKETDDKKEDANEE